MAVSLRAVVKNNLQATGYFLVNESKSAQGNTLFSLTKKVGGRPVTIHLELVNGGLWVNPPKYTFSSTVSHFDFTEQEQRWTRRKDIITNVVAALMKAEVWSFIQNKNFFTVNENCKSFQKQKDLKTRVLEEFKDCLDPKSRVKRDAAKMKELTEKASTLLKGVKKP
jgi:glycogen debranching enzyme